MNQDEDHGVSRYSNIRILILLLHYIVSLYSNCKALCFSTYSYHTFTKSVE